MTAKQLYKKIDSITREQKFDSGRSLNMVRNNAIIELAKLCAGDDYWSAGKFNTIIVNHFEQGGKS